MTNDTVTDTNGKELRGRVLTFGVFDYFHLGHLRLFKQCREHGDYLIVAVQDGDYIKKTKPDSQILYTTEQRKELVGALRAVDEVVTYTDVDVTIQTIDFDVFAVGEDQNHAGFQRAMKWCEDNGKKVVRLHRTPGICSSEIKLEKGSGTDAALAADPGTLNARQPLTSEDLKQIQIGILDAVHEFCAAHDIQYWLDSGTLLGAIRHKGYIPWDDDIDIGMLRPDFERFLSLFSKGGNDSRYYVICNELDPACPYAYAKVLDRQTVLYEPDENGPELRVNIDIFVYDNAPVDDRECNRMYRMRDIYRSMNLLQNRMIGGHGVVKDFITFWGYHILRHYPTGCFATKVSQNAQRYAGQVTGYVGNFTPFARIKVPTRVFDSFIEVPFEGKMYPAPVGYDEWLRAFYGDYMQLPSEEKRVSHHMFVGYRL